MAVISRFKEKKDDQPQSGTFTTGGTAAPTAPGMATQQAQNQPAGSGTFTNLQKILNANQSAGSRLAGAVGRTVQTDVAKSGKDVKDLDTSFRGAVQQERDRLAQGLGEESTFQKAVKADPTSLTADKDNAQGQFQQFRKLYEDQDISEQQAKELADRQARIAAGLTSTQQSVGALGTEQGRGELLRKALVKPNYSRGQNLLDQIVLQSDAKSNQLLQNKTSDFRKQLAGQRALGETASKELSGFIGENKLNEAAVAEQLKTLVSGQETSLINAQSGEVQDINARRNARMNALNKFSTTGGKNLTADELKIVEEELTKGGLSTGTKIYDLTKDDIKKRINAAKIIDNIADVMDQKEVDRYNALRDLAAIKERQFTKAGDIGSEGSIDALQLQKDIEGARSKFEQGLSGKTLTAQERLNLLATVPTYGSSPSTTVSGGTVTYDASANALELLKALEGLKRGGKSPEITLNQGGSYLSGWDRDKYGGTYQTVTGSDRITVNPDGSIRTMPSYVSSNDYIGSTEDASRAAASRAARRVMDEINAIMQGTTYNRTLGDE